MKPYVYLWSYLFQFFSQWEIFGKSYKENQNTYFMFNNFFPENRAVYVILWKNIVEQYEPQVIIQRMPIVCWCLRL